MDGQHSGKAHMSEDWRNGRVINLYIKIPMELWDRLAKMARDERRLPKQQILWLLQEFVEKYEEEHLDLLTKR
jgi:hypothetical protein